MLDFAQDCLNPVDGVLNIHLVSVIISQHEVSKVIRQFQTKQIFLQQKQIDGKLLDLVFDLPSSLGALVPIDSLFDLGLALEDVFVAFDGAAWHEENVGGFYVGGLLLEQLVNHHLHGG